jgi:hypothetical protein
VYKKLCGEQYDMWVAYVTTAEPTALSHRATLIPEELTDDIWDTADQTQIEMVVTVLVDRKSPFTSHSGIFRTERFWIPKEKNTRLQMRSRSGIRGYLYRCINLRRSCRGSSTAT